ncbi:MAG: RNA polymerase subunit sigma-70 [Planctomycetota bacterium]|nr:MAG: RNA polymerase subunit sigma-70 [Planctomycetota bacterium]
MPSLREPQLPLRPARNCVTGSGPLAPLPGQETSHRPPKSRLRGRSDNVSDQDRVSHWIDQVKQGDSLAAHRIWEHYFDSLLRSVRQRLAGQNRGPSDEEDVVLSVFKSFYAAAQRGRFPNLSSRDDLWHLLLRMAARKIIDKRRHDRRLRRGGDADIRSLDSPNIVHEVIGNEPSPEMVLMMQESMEEFLGSLGVGSLRDLAVAKLEGYSNRELALRFECSERTIERRLHLIREKLQQGLLQDDDRPPE